MPTIPSLHYGNMYQDDKYALLRLKKYASLISNKIKANDKILEIGCYTADILDFLPKNIEYCGVDFDIAALHIAAAKGAKVINIDFDRGDIPISNNVKFDIIIATEVFEHLANPESIISKTVKLLKEEGIIIISLPNENTLYHRLMSLFGFGIDLCAFQRFKHLHLPTLAQSERFVSEYFRIREKEYYINPGAKGSKWEILGKILTLIPDRLWERLAYIFPSLFARGVIFVCYNKITK